VVLVWVLAACGPEKVRQHLLGPALERLLRDGPRPDGAYAEDIRRRWSTHHRLIRGNDLCDALINEWDRTAAATEPKFTCTGVLRPFIRNPLWSAAAGPLYVAEVLTGMPTYRRSSADTSRSQRYPAGWLSDSTGDSGSGKSAPLHHRQRRTGQ
jgi:hypothetical protein